MPHHLTPEDARRLAIRAQLLSAERPAGIVEAIDALTVVGIEPTAAIAPSPSVGFYAGWTEATDETMVALQQLGWQTTDGTRAHLTTEPTGSDNPSSRFERTRTRSGEWTV